MTIINHWRNREIGCLVLAPAALTGLAATKRKTAAGKKKTSDRVAPVHRDRCGCSVTVHVFSNAIKIANSLANVKQCFGLWPEYDFEPEDKTDRGFDLFSRLLGAGFSEWLARYMFPQNGRYRK